MLEDINRKGTTIIMVTHDQELARRAHRNIQVLDGQVSDLDSIYQARLDRLAGDASHV